MRTYIHIKVKALLEIEDAIDENDVGTTVADYYAGKWIELSDEQNDFRLANPDASMKEVIEMQLAPLPPEPPEPPEQGRYTREEKDEFIEGLMEGLGYASA